MVLLVVPSGRILVRVSSHLDQRFPFSRFLIVPGGLEVRFPDLDSAPMLNRFMLVTTLPMAPQSCLLVLQLFDEVLGQVQLRLRPSVRRIGACVHVCFMKLAVGFVKLPPSSGEIRLDPLVAIPKPLRPTRSDGGWTR